MVQRSRILWIAVLIVAAWYIMYYYRPPKQIAILQTTLPDFTFDILLQRQPIVLYDRVADWDELKKAWFPSNRTEVETNSNNANVVGATATDEWIRNYYKYLFIQPVQDTEIFLYPAHKKLREGRPPTDETLLTIKLKSAQALILPYRWHYCVPSKITYSTFGIHDLLTPWLPR